MSLNLEIGPSLGENLGPPLPGMQPGAPAGCPQFDAIAACTECQAGLQCLPAGPFGKRNLPVACARRCPLASLRGNSYLQI